MSSKLDKFKSYATGAHDEFSRPIWYMKRDANNVVDKKALALCLPVVAGQLKESIKFKLPDNGLILKTKDDESIKRTLNTFLNEIHLPYPVVALEYDTFVMRGDTKGEGQIIGVDRNEGDGVYPSLLILEEKENYITTTFCFYIKDGGWQILGVDDLRLDKKTFDFYEHEKPKRKFRESVVKDFQLEKIITSFLCALSCGNTEIEIDDEKPPTLKEKMRKSKGKLPTFSYKVLTIGGRKQKGAVGLGGHHNSPRIHLRRGHIRRLPAKNVWVNACVVGDKSKGVIHKDYNVEELSV